ncbi:class 3 adenylate cyclase/RecA/RadA recombinase [Mycobacterium sp. OAS707]|uniref:AAA family ATPase n=1 Tax=Mycobacterium sp. OAS707 TaxID=2663822 RepID=UPI001788E938|nr:adenylate/guanylate cyclase domain-containing protein [Mycobacterium sp. OAS707]MBE1549811.1 class 3 adenylate cyclase/RecA/RadA recombinase [Mycobacterium sp. OAS707]
MTAVTSLCTGCGAELRANNNFCHQCGARIILASTPAEYKQVTVLFADVVRSMDIAAIVDIERLREIMADLLERSASVLSRYGGTVEYHGDGVMAIFGAPVALEDHAFRACVAALTIQDEAKAIADQVQIRDGVELRLRVGLNSGEVIAGDIGSGSLGYRATGQPVGLAQRMEGAAPPGGVMLSESTARLVEHSVLLTEPEWVRIKGADEPVRARRLLAISPPDGSIRRAEASLVGRRWEMAALKAISDNAIAGRGGVVNVVGPPGIGKSRVAREAAAAAASRGVEVFWTFCESHARDVPFHAATRLLRAGSGVADFDSQTARKRVRARMPADADPLDLLLLDDLLGIAEPNVTLPEIDRDARRRRLTALVNSAWLARTDPTLFIIEDAHWVDAVSESMLADFLGVIPRTPSMVLITSRPDYDGALMRVHGAQTIALAPLGDSDTAELLGELLGSDPSVGELAAIITERAAGNPFFAEEMVRELAQRGALVGDHAEYVCRVDVTELSVPATVQAAIEARIDRLSTPAKRTLNAAAVIGARFDAELLARLGIDESVDELLSTELIDQVRFTPSARYAFRHPLIRAVAYESQLKSDRADWHRRLAAAIQESGPSSVEENAALIAEHLESAGELHAAYGWHMRAGAWLTNRDVGAARISWERACRIADALPDDDTGRLSMRIAPRTMLCATDWQGHQATHHTHGRFAELRELCSAAGDKVSLAVGMSGLITELLYAQRTREGSRLASEQMALLDSIGDPTLTVGLAFVAFAIWFEAGEFGEISRWSQTVIDLAAGDPAKGAGFGVGSPLAIGLAFRAIGRWWQGRPGWRQDLDDAIAMVRNSDPATAALVLTWTYGAVLYGVLRPDDSILSEIEAVVQSAHRAGSDHAMFYAEYLLGGMLLYRDDAADRHRGLDLAARGYEWQREQAPSLLPVTDLVTAPERARRGDRDGAILLARNAVDEIRRPGRIGYGVLAAGILVEMLLERGADGDVAEANEAIDWLSSLRADQGSAILEITLLRLRALLAGARGDAVTYRDLVTRYRAMAESLGYEGHMAWAAAMSKGDGI